MTQRVQEQPPDSELNLLVVLEGPLQVRRTHRTFNGLEYLARLLTHVPDNNETGIRYNGAYSVRRRAHWGSLGILTETRSFAEERKEPQLPTWSALQARRWRWAEFLQRIFEVDPPTSPMRRTDEDPRLRPRP